MEGNQCGGGQPGLRHNQRSRAQAYAQEPTPMSTHRRWVRSGAGHVRGRLFSGQHWPFGLSPFRPHRGPRPHLGNHGETHFDGLNAPQAQSCQGYHAGPVAMCVGMATAGLLAPPMGPGAKPPGDVVGDRLIECGESDTPGGSGDGRGHGLPGHSGSGASVRLEGIPHPKPIGGRLFHHGGHPHPAVPFVPVMVVISKP